MALDAGSGFATRLIQVFLLIFAGFATLLLRIYETDVEEMESGSTEMLAWLFMSFSIMPVYPAFLLSLILLTREGSLVTEYIAYLLGIFITLPTLVLTSVNLYIGVAGSENVEFALYQRVVSCVSTLFVWISTIVIISWHFSLGLLSNLSNCGL